VAVAISHEDGRAALAGTRDGVAQDRDMLDNQGLPPVQQVHREKPAPARYERATIIRHVAQDSTGYIGVITERRITPEPVIGPRFARTRWTNPPFD
jgi:hypothetical protein